MCGLHSSSSCRYKSVEQCCVLSVCVHIYCHFFLHIFEIFYFRCFFRTTTYSNVGLSSGYKDGKLAASAIDVHRAMLECRYFSYPLLFVFTLSSILAFLDGTGAVSVLMEQRVYRMHVFTTAYCLPFSVPARLLTCGASDDLHMIHTASIYPGSSCEPRGSLVRLSWRRSYTSRLDMPVK